MNSQTKEEFVIRNIREQERSEVEKLYRQRVLYNDEHHIHQWDLEDVTWGTFSKLYTSKDCYVGVYEGKLACSMMIVDIDELYWPQALKKEALYLHKICVHPKFRGLGLADRMITYFIDKGKREGYGKVRLDVREHKKKLREMYERNGFLLVQIKKVHKEFYTALYELIL